MSENVLNSKKQVKSIEETFTKKTQLEHILLRPDTYVGSIERQVLPMWVLDAESKKMVNRQCGYVPGLFKIFDEILVNAADNKQRDPTMSRIEVTIDGPNNLIRVWNNGNGIPVVVHKEHNIYVPELIFGHLLTGSNFNDSEQKTTGGRNGYGAKLANIFSTQFIIETVDSSRGLKYKQTFENNMGTCHKPQITKFSGTDYTCITFKPDLERFKMSCLDEDVVSLLSKRVYDIAGTNTSAGAKLTVHLNGSKVEAKNFQQYVSMYQDLEDPVVFSRINERWEVGVGISDGSFQQISFVNSICTSKGGQHVNYIADQITSRLVTSVKKKNKGAEVKPANIKNHLAIYVNALIVNPAFDSQTKETMTTREKGFGSTCVLPEALLKKIDNSGVIDAVLRWAKNKQDTELKRKGGSKHSKVLGINKLDDANFAGTAKSRGCTLILTEGDSAKSLAISGLGVVGRDYYGVFPLKGKLLNVREANHAQIMKNEEIQNVSKILGLTYGKKYEDVSSLRYGHIMIMADQDHDGSHIKGLVINFLHHFWPSLLKVEGFVQQFITPIVKCVKGKREDTFYTIPEYHSWKETHENGKNWKIKYYKGLGTSTSAEAKEYFSNLPKHGINFAWNSNTDDCIELAFAKKRVDDRKQWLLNMDPDVFMDYSQGDISYDEFVNNELILFSHADNERSIPHMMDGFKPSQRKVLFSCFKRNLKSEIKVAQLAGYVSEHSAYHHGEMSLTQTIIGMAQNFVGSNNINLLSPCGQFGTRLMGGKDAASPRYVFTKLQSVTRCIFHPHDDAVLDYLEEDGQSIEPAFYVPVIPMALVNGSDGIGTGWSTGVPTYNPREIIHNLRKMIQGESQDEMKPWFRGFTGEVRPKAGKDFGKSYVVSGNYEQVNDATIQITELPVGKWTSDYKQLLESMLVGNSAAASDSAAAPLIVKDFKEHHTDTTVSFTVNIVPEKMLDIESEVGGIQKKFKLDGSVATTNMHMFDLRSRIHKYDNVAEIMNAFFDVRLEFYEKRKSNLVTKLTSEWEKLDNKVRFILAVIKGELVVSNRKKQELLQELQRAGYKQFSAVVATDDDAQDEDAPALDKGYDYLLSMKLWSLTMERVADLTRERGNKRDELDELVAKTIEDLWIGDLDALEIALDEYEGAIDESKAEELAARKKASKTSKSSSVSRAPYVPKAAVVKAPVVKATSSSAIATTKKAPVTAALAESKPDPKPKKETPAAPLSLADRLMQRMALDENNSASSNISIMDTQPKPNDARRPTAAPARSARGGAKAKKVVYALDSEEESVDYSDASESESEVSDDDFTEYGYDEPKRATAAKKSAAPVKKAPVTKARPVKVVKEDEDFSEEEVVKPKKAAPKAKAPAKKAAGNSITSYFSDLTVETKKKAAPKKAVKKIEYSEDESEALMDSLDSESDGEFVFRKPAKKAPAKASTAYSTAKKAPVEKVSTITTPPKARPGRNVAKKVYVMSESEDDFDEDSEEDDLLDSEDEFSEDAFTPPNKKQTTKKRANTKSAPASKFQLSPGILSPALVKKARKL